MCEQEKNIFFLSDQENFKISVRGRRKTKNKLSRASLLVYFEIASRLRWKISASTRRVVIAGRIEVFVSRFCKVQSLGNWHRLRYRCVHAAWRLPKSSLRQFTNIHFNVHEIWDLRRLT